MKYLLLISALFLFSHANSQVKDSVDETELMVNALNHMFGKVDGKELPAFTARDLNGKIYTNKDIKAKATFLNLWFANCQPCIEEIPHLNRLYKMFKDSTGFAFYSITFETKEKAMDFVNKYGINFPILLVSPGTAKLLNFGRGYPTNMVLDSQGKVHSIFCGIRYTEVDGYFKPELEKLLKDQGN